MIFIFVDSSIIGAAAFSVILAIASAAVTHFAVRYAAGTGRLGAMAVAFGLLSAAFYWGDALGGFWPGVYALLSVYTLACIATPWIDYFWKQRRAD
ncbi:MAG: hypothetical protein AAGE43_15500 [Pseudomonadota bacterium]